MFDGYFREFNSLETLLFYEFDKCSPYTTLVMKGILSAQCFYRTPCEGVSPTGEEEAVWAAVQDRYEKALGQLNPVVKDDLDRYLMERLLVTLTRVRQRRRGEA